MFEKNKDDLLKDELKEKDEAWMKGFEVDVVETFFEEWPENDSDP